MPHAAFFSAVAATGVVIAASMATLPLAESFPLQRSAMTRRRKHSSSSTPLNAIADPPMSPGYAEEEKDKRKKISGDTSSSHDSNDGWTETEEGGFVPNIFRSKRARPRHGRDVVKRIEHIQEYKSVVVDEKEQITVVRFHAPWCKTCKAAEKLFYKLAADYADHGVQFIDVPTTKDNAYLHQGLGVPSVPWVHIYHPEAGLCEERTMSTKHFEKVRRCLECYVNGSCDMDGDECPF